MMPDTVKDFLEPFRLGIQRGCISIDVRPKGYWAETVCGQLRRESQGQQVTWVPKLGHSSGGRDTKEVPCDLEAEQNFAQAIAETAAQLRQLKGLEADLEAIYQEAQHARG